MGGNESSNANPDTNNSAEESKSTPAPAAPPVESSEKEKIRLQRLAMLSKSSASPQKTSSESPDKVRMFAIFNFTLKFTYVQCSPSQIKLKRNFRRNLKKSELMKNGE